MSSSIGRRIAIAGGRMKAGLVALASMVGLVGAVAPAAEVGPDAVPDGRAPPARAPRRKKKSKLSRASSYVRRSWNRYAGAPQGARECARRRGGVDWKLERDLDRDRRGLFPLYFNEHGA